MRSTLENVGLAAKIIRWFYEKTIYAQEDSLFSLHLTRPLFYKLSADGNLLLDWAHELHNGFDTNFPVDLAEALRNCVVIEKVEIANFDFSKIESLSSSKGFGENFHPKINGSWFKDAASWGRAMYPADNLSGLDDHDWNVNIGYIENREGFPKNRPISVFYYAWLDRYEGYQSGGSHHTAMILHQMEDQSRPYTRDARLTKYSINVSSIEKFCDHYYMFVTSEKMYAPRISNNDVSFLVAMKKYLASDFYTTSIRRSVNNAIICFIPYNALKVERSVFEQWCASQQQRRSIVPFIDLLKNTLKYCDTPYLHELQSCYLGDPFRHNDKAVKSMAEVPDNIS